VTLPPGYAYRHGVLCVEEVALPEVAARFGTPTYVYSRAAISDAFLCYADALTGRKALVCYAVKANSNLAILDLLARLGAGFDIVSGGELARVLAAGGRADRVIFSGVGKRGDEIKQALIAGIRCFNVESVSELERIELIAASLGMRAPVSLRVNPNVDARTHPYISTGLKESKFGIAFADAFEIYRRAAVMPHLEVVGIDCHIGSQLTESAPLFESLQRLTELIDRLDQNGIAIKHLDLGGGVGVRYRDEAVIEIGDFIAEVLQQVDAWRSQRYGGSSIELLFEPGRSVVANAGLLLTRIEYLKPGVKNFAVLDAAMNDLLRPALYDAFHEVVPVAPAAASAEMMTWDLVGPVCESGDWLARERRLALREGDLLAILSAGAYAMSMASNYNARSRPAEVLIDGQHMHLVRDRESIEDLYRHEHLLPVAKP
jgi:diaminopimelate decarboxylase